MLIRQIFRLKYEKNFSIECSMAFCMTYTWRLRLYQTYVGEKVGKTIAVFFSLLKIRIRHLPVNKVDMVPC